MKKSIICLFGIFTVIEINDDWLIQLVSQEMVLLKQGCKGQQVVSAHSIVTGDTDPVSDLAIDGIGHRNQSWGRDWKHVDILANEKAL